MAWWEQKRPVVPKTKTSEPGKRRLARRRGKGKGEGLQRSRRGRMAGGDRPAV